MAKNFDDFKKLLSETWEPGWSEFIADLPDEYPEEDDPLGFKMTVDLQTRRIMYILSRYHNWSSHAD